jgi:hypothetical protein
MFGFSKSLSMQIGLLALVVSVPALALVVRAQGNSGGAPPVLDVNVVNTPRVVVANTPDATAQAAHFSLYGVWDDGSFTALSDEYVVPPGKRLVIEHVSGSAELTPGQTQHYILLRVSQGDASFQHTLPVSQPIAFTETQATASYSQALRMYVDAGGALRAVSGRTYTAGFADFSMSVSGYLVDVP